MLGIFIFMKKKIRLTESELINLIKRIVKEEKFSTQDLTYNHPVTGKECKIKIARNKVTDTKFKRYGAVLTCDVYDNGKEMVVAELPATGPTPEYVNDLICDNLDTTIAMLDDMFENETEDLAESVESNRWTVIEDPIVCRSDKFLDY
jgi:hypothetical protein